MFTKVAQKIIRKVNQLGSRPLPSKVREAIETVRSQNLTYLTEAKLNALATLCLKLDDRDIPGVIIETGCALGGSSIVMSAAKKQARKLWVYDVFSMIPPPSEQDGEDVQQRYEVIQSGQSEGIGGDTYYGYVDRLYEKVASNFQEFGYPIEENQVTLIRGLVQDTLHINEPVCLAHIDVDWYEPVLICLERIEPHLSVGGTLVIDDYLAWSGCQRAVDEYFDRKDRSRYQFDTSPGSLLVTKLS
jgi:O-methyltransferase